MEPETSSLLFSHVESVLRFSGIWHRVCYVGANVFEEPVACIFREEVSRMVKIVCNVWKVELGRDCERANENK
jgi:hypothetical protein